MNQLAEEQTQVINSVFSSYGIQAYVSEVSVQSSVNTFYLTLGPGTRVRTISAIEEEIALALCAPNVRISKKDGRVAIEVSVARKTPETLWDVIQEVRKPPPFCAVLGRDMNGVPLLLRFSSPEVSHVLIAGTTGSGKTALARSIFASLSFFNTRKDLRIVLIDPKRRGFEAISEMPTMATPLIDSVEGAVETLNSLVEEMIRRDADKRSLPRLIVGVDEIADLMTVGEDSIRVPLTRIAQRGREAGIHLVGLTQKPNSSILGPLLKANFPVRLVGAVANKDEARYASGVRDSGAEKLKGRGDFILVAGGTVERFKGSWLNSDAYNKMFASKGVK
jgi:S-DNA-T family DNA segregation ATPase FtsK/SpoIIIE